MFQIGVNLAQQHIEGGFGIPRFFIVGGECVVATGAKTLVVLCAIFPAGVTMRRRTGTGTGDWASVV